MKLKFSENWGIKTKKIVLSTFILAVAFILSFFIWKFNIPGVKRTFVFQASDSDSLMLENRYISSKTVKSFADELLLGPMSEHCKTVFERGTKVLSCFVRKGVLYINFSSDLLKADAENTDFAKQIELFKKNIFLNYKNIKQIDVFIDGNVPHYNYK